MTERRRPLRTLFLTYDQVNLLDIAGPLQAMEAAESTRATPERYQTIVASMAGGPIETAARIPIVTKRLGDLDPTTIDTVIVGGGSANGRPLAPPELVDWLSDNAPSFRRTCSICAGAFILAKAGLLDGRRAATHWRWTELLSREHPTIHVEPDPIYIQDGPFWTSAGVTAGIDLALALIEQDYGHSIAIEAARRLVVFMKRPGGQAQFSTPLLFQSRRDGGFDALHAWIRENIASDLRIGRLAEQAGMSERSFVRAYTAAIGTTPAKAVEAMRVETAALLLETTRHPLKLVAAATGFGDEQNLRRVFQRRLGVNPLDYRERFAGGGN